MAEQEQKITVRPHGPYVVRGQIPLVRKSQVETEFGEPYDWKQESALDTTETYRLCRCGRSENELFCDSTHTLVLFDGEETADTGPISSREKVFKGDDVVVKDDHSLCAHAGYCGTRFTNIWKMLEESGDPEVRDKIKVMVDLCPSGTLAHALDESSEVVEPELPREVGVVADGPLWVSGRITVERRAGKPIEVRNRITPCRCGQSGNKPFCDGVELGVAHPWIGYKWRLFELEVGERKDASVARRPAGRRMLPHNCFLSSYMMK
jgi:CDGSH-type Zn-finger protein